MALYTWYQESTVRTVFEVPVPCQLGEVRAMVFAVHTELKERGEDPSWDTCAQVECDGETLRFVITEAPVRLPPGQPTERPRTKIPGVMDCGTDSPAQL